MNFCELRLLLEFESPLQHKDNLASAIRGIWGRTLKSIYCLQRQKECQDCEMRHCTYYLIFERSGSEEDLFHPYIIHFIGATETKVIVVFKFIGWTCEHLEKLLLSILRMEHYPMTQLDTTNKFKIAKILDIQDREIYSAGSETIKTAARLQLNYEPEKKDKVTLRFTSPYRQKINRKRLVRDFMWEPFWTGLYRRVKFLDKAFNRSELGLPEEMGAGTVQIISSDLQWEEFYRKSARQNAKMSLGGLVGKVSLLGISPEQYGILKLGSYLHAGRQTTFGNGKYYLEPLT